MREEPANVVVVAIYCQPRTLETLTGECFTPLRSQGALAVPGRSVNEDQLWSPPRAEAVKNPLPSDRRAIESGWTKTRRCTRRILSSSDRTRPVRPQSVPTGLPTFWRSVAAVGRRLVCLERRRT